MQVLTFPLLSPYSSSDSSDGSLASDMSGSSVSMATKWHTADVTSCKTEGEGCCGTDDLRFSRAQTERAFTYSLTPDLTFYCGVYTRTVTLTRSEMMQRRLQFTSFDKYG